MANTIGLFPFVVLNGYFLDVLKILNDFCICITVWQCIIQADQLIS